MSCEEFDFKKFPKENCRYIFDYEIFGSNVTGLDLIKVNKLGDRAVLVTSYFNDPKIQNLVQEASATMLAKFMISEIEIKIANEDGSSGPENNRRRKNVKGSYSCGVGFGFDWIFSNLASQRQLGLLSQRRSWACSDYPAYLDLDGTAVVLERAGESFC